MSKNTKAIIQFVILLGVGILLVWLSFRSVWSKKDDIFKAFQNANYFWVFISAGIAFFSHFLRAYRWNYLLKPLGYKVNPLNSLGAVLVGYFANYGLPRMGEITRCTLVRKYDNVPFEVALGTVITERIVDTFLLLVIFFLTLFAQFTQLKDLSARLIFNPLMGKLQGLSSSPVKLIILIAIIVITIIGFLMLRKKMATLFKGKLGNILKGFGKGISSIKDMDHKFQFVVLSLGIWASYFYALYFCFFAFTGTSHLGHSECLVLLLFGTLGIVFTPGGIGVYPAIITGLLTATYQIDEISAFSLPWLSWTLQFVLIVSLGLISLIVLPIINKSAENVVSPEVK